MDAVEKFREIDDGLRIVVTYDDADWELQYIRSDLADSYTDEDFEKTYREHIASQVSSENLGKVITGGDLTGELFLFEKVVVFQFPSSRYEGLFVSYDWYESFPLNAVFRAAEEISIVQ